MRVLMKKIVDFEKCEINICRHSSHNIPNMIVLRPGIYVHKCPGCYQEQTVTIPFLSHIITVSQVATVVHSLKTSYETC